MTGSVAALSAPPEGQQASKSDRIMALASAIEWRHIVSSNELEAVERLRYQCYLREGAILPNDTKRLGDSFDLEPGTSVFGFYLHDRLIASIRVHILDAASAVSPTMLAFPDAIEPMISAGQRLVDSSRFMVDAQASHDHPNLAFIVLRAPLIVIQALTADGALTAVRREHVAVYTRLLRMRQIKEPRAYHQLTKPLALCHADCRADIAGVLQRNPFMRLFGGELDRLATVVGWPFSSTPNESRT